MRKNIIMMLMLLVSVAAMGKDLKTVTFTTTPQMHCANCEQKIKGNLRFERGVKEIKTQVEEQKVIVTYDADKTSVEKLLKGFEKFGYKARQLKEGEKVARNTAEQCTNM